MADNVELNAGSGGATVAADEIAGVQHQRVKIQYGVDGSATDVSDSNPLPIDDAGGSITVDGTVTANLSATDNAVLDAIQAAVEIVDDWDESDRAKVNPIVGQAGIAAGAGAVGASTPRVTLASDDPAVALLGTIDADTSALAGAVSGSEVQVDVVAPLPAGTNNIGDVDVASLPSTVHSADFDTGGGTDTTLAFGIAVPASGGAAVVPGDATAGLKVDLGADNDVTVSSSALPTGAATAANQSTANAALGAIQTAVETLDNAIAGSEMQVDVVGSLPAGDNNIGNVDVVTVPTDPFGANADAASATGSISAKLRRLATDLSAVVSGSELQVDVVTSALPSGAATAANQSTMIGHVDGIEGLLTTMDADTSTLAGAVSGSEMQVDVVAALPTGSNVIGDVGLAGSRTSGGTTPYRNVDVDESEDEVKGTAGQVYWLHAVNLTAAVLYLHIYNATAASVTVGTTTPTLTFALPTQGDTNGAGFNFSVPNGIAFGTAITVACTTTVGGSSGPAANGCILNLGYA